MRSIHARDLQAWGLNVHTMIRPHSHQSLSRLLEYLTRDGQLLTVTNDVTVSNIVGVVQTLACGAIDFLDLSQQLLSPSKKDQATSERAFLQALLAHGCDINVMFYNTNVCHDLVDAGARLDIRAANGNTVLHSLVHGHINFSVLYHPRPAAWDSVKKILRHQAGKAMVNSLNKGGLSPYHLALGDEISFSGNEDFVDLLARKRRRHHISNTSREALGLPVTEARRLGGRNGNDGAMDA